MCRFSKSKSQQLFLLMHLRLQRRSKKEFGDVFARTPKSCNAEVVELVDTQP
ncbi:hypothetical protein KPSA3_05930 [Pseudomonas syringae pv. actinidiae]|uniref:Uncharacterized protein n=1 Tax=Pseudomonas syringae pv. actinidiae TaxID=103796 RepID=A0AAN4QA90_PSESF|nr:hypothetical protein KPSA3_05930 [Pseudomonas syringae pv. actinidiae]